MISNQWIEKRRPYWDRLAMLAAACWLHWRERRPIASITAAAAMSVVLFFCHLMALVFFLVLIGSAEVVAIRRERRGLFRSASLLPVIAGPLVLALLMPLRDAPAATHWMTLQEKLLQLASPFINYLLPLDIISSGLVAGAVVESGQPGESFGQRGVLA